MPNPSNPSRARERPLSKKPPRIPLYISQRKSDGGLLYVRRLPQALMDAGLLSASKPTKRIALGTRDWLAAQTLARQLSAADDREWARLRTKLERAPAACASVNPRKLQPDDIPVLSRRLEALLMHTDDVDRSRALTAEEFDGYEEQLNAQRKALRNANQRADLAAVAEEAAGFLQAEGLDCDEASPQWMSWLKAVLQAHLTALSRIASRLDGEGVDTPAVPPPVRSEDDLDELDRAVQYWQSKSQPKSKTVVEVRSAMRRFKEATGRTRISAIRPGDVIAFMRAERERDSARGGKVNVQTVNKALALLKGVFAVVHADYLVHQKIDNPLLSARKFKVKAGDVARRRYFSREQLTTLFSGPVHARGQRPAGGAGEAAYWMPVLGYATGARMQELLQLAVEDVVTIDGVMLLRTETQYDEHDVPDNDATTAAQRTAPQPERSLKSNESYRFIPLHRDVLALGFGDYVAWVRDMGHTQLFPDVRPGIHDSWSANFSRFFNRYLRKLGIKERLLDSVSFRHDFKSQSRSIAAMKQDVADYIQGHAWHRASQGYGHFPADVLDYSINLMSFPALQVAPRWTPPPRRRGAGARCPSQPAGG